MKQGILITGGAGYIGSHVACLLAQYDYNIIIIDSYNHHQNFNPAWATIYRADFTDKKLLTHILAKNSIQTVVHCAALIEVGESVKNPAVYYENNVSKTLVLLDTMLQANIKKFIFSSSCAVYGEPQTNFLSEDHPHNSISPYGKTKSIIESVLHDYQAAYGLHYINLRYFNAAGAWPEQGLYEQHVPESHLVPLVLNAVLRKEPFTIFGNDYPTPDGSALRDFIHVRDIAQAHLCALRHLEKQLPSDSFNIGSSQPTSIKQLVKLIQDVAGNSIDINYGARRTGDPAILVANTTKAQNILAWKPIYSNLEFIISSVLHAYVAHTQEQKILL